MPFAMFGGIGVSGVVDGRREGATATFTVR